MVMRGKSKQRGYGPNASWLNDPRHYEKSVDHSSKAWGNRCRTTIAARNGEDFSKIPEGWCAELVRVSRIVAEKMEMFDVDEASDYCVYSVLKVLKDRHDRGECFESASNMFSFIYSYCVGVCKSIRTHHSNDRTVAFDFDVHQPEVYDMILDESAFHLLSDRARTLLNEAIMYASGQSDTDVTYTTKGNIRVRSTRKTEELSMFTVARLKLGWASSTASRVVNEIRDNFFPNYCVRMDAIC